MRSFYEWFLIRKGMKFNCNNVLPCGPCQTDIIQLATWYNIFHNFNTKIISIKQKYSCGNKVKVLFWSFLFCFLWKILPNVALYLYWLRLAASALWFTRMGLTQGKYNKQGTDYSCRSMVGFFLFFTFFNS